MRRTISTGTVTKSQMGFETSRSLPWVAYRRLSNSSRSDVDLGTFRVTWAGILALTHNA